MNTIPPVDPSGKAHKPHEHADGSRKSPHNSAFKETLQGFMKDIDKMQSQADQSLENIQKAIHNVDQAKNAMQEAENAYTTMMEFRDKILKTYDEISRMRRQ
jgi:flagellar hook-basal body complex protein FliE